MEFLMQIAKAHKTTSQFSPLEQVRVMPPPGAARLQVRDGAGRTYVDVALKTGARRKVSFLVRGTAGRHAIDVLDAQGRGLAQQDFRLAPRTQTHCDAGPYAELMTQLQYLIQGNAETQNLVIDGRSYRILVCWSRDHVYTLKAAQYWETDVQSGLDYYLERQLPSGMFWDCIYTNTEAPAPTWLGEALGQGWFTYDDHGRYIVRRVPVLADTEYVFTEGVWYGWKASGDDAWMAAQLPRLEKALTYLTTDPLRWSPKEGLIRRSFTADEWDFANPHYCAGDHRCIHPGDPRFLFHGNQSGLYAMCRHLAEMHEHLGHGQRARELRAQAEALRKRANRRLFFGTQYGHMIPEDLPGKQVYDLVGDERQRMSLSTGYTINRGLPTHDMAVKILKEYQRRGQRKKGESFAEWWTMDPPYTPEQWPGQHTHTAGCPVGEYMNGGVCIIIAGEIAKAAYDHGAEAYATDILERVWKLRNRDGGNLHQVYRRLPENPQLPAAHFQLVDLRGVVNRGLRHGATRGVDAWTSEGTNDMRNLPTGRRNFGAIAFDVIAPPANAGRSVLRLDPDPATAPTNVTIPLANLRGKSLYFLHALAHSAPAGKVIGTYDVGFDDGTVERIYLRSGKEIGLWWGSSAHAVDPSVARRAWWGPNPTWKNVGMYMFGWTNPHPAKAITAIRATALDPAGHISGSAAAGAGTGGILLGAISVSDQAVEFEPRIRSYGLPDAWAQAAVYYAIAEGLAGVSDAGVAFDRVGIAPRWAGSKARRAGITLHYPASDGYCAYEYRLDPKRRTITLDLTGSLTRAGIHCLLPGRSRARQVRMDGRDLAFRNTRVEASCYVDFDLEALPRAPVVVHY